MAALKDIRPRKSAYLITIVFFLVGGGFLAYSIVQTVEAFNPVIYSDLNREAEPYDIWDRGRYCVPFSRRLWDTVVVQI